MDKYQNTASQYILNVCSSGAHSKIPRKIAHIGTVCNGQILQWDLMSEINILTGLKLAPFSTFNIQHSNVE